VHRPDLAPSFASNNTTSLSCDEDQDEISVIQSIDTGIGNDTGKGLPAVFPKRVPRVRVRFPDLDTVPKPHPSSAVCGYAQVEPGQ
jgi:hypothetical protein